MRVLGTNDGSQNGVFTDRPGVLRHELLHAGYAALRVEATDDANELFEAGMSDWRGEIRGDPRRLVLVSGSVLRALASLRV